MRSLRVSEFQINRRNRLIVNVSWEEALTHTSNLKWHAWQYLSGESAGTLNFAVADGSCPAAESLVDSLKVGDVITVGLSQLPTGSPHHLDSTEEMCSDEKRIFRMLQIEVSSTHSLMAAYIENRTLAIQVPYLLLGSISGGITESTKNAYVGEITQPIDLLDSNGDIQRTELWLWACTTDGIVYC